MARGSVQRARQELHNREQCAASHFWIEVRLLIRATTSFFCALTPVPRVIKEGPRFHFLACYKVGTPAATSQVDGNKMMMRFRPHHIVATGAVRHPRSRAATCFCHQHAHRAACRRFAEGDAHHIVAGPAEPANQPGLDWIAADPEHDRDGRGRRLRCRRLAPAATIAAICCLTCFAPFLI